MCGISFIINGITIAEGDGVIEQQINTTTNNNLDIHTNQDIIEDLKKRLYNRGPDSIKSHIVHIPCKSSLQDNATEKTIELTLLASVLGMRGPLTPQPVHDSHGNILMWNGELFGGYQVGIHDNDTSLLLELLNQNDENEKGIDSRKLVETLLKIQGPFAFVYWNANARRLWFGRDVLGRRSLLVNRSPNRFVLSSIGSFPNGIDDSKSLPKWDEVNTFGLYSIQFPDIIPLNNSLKLESHSWDNSNNTLNIGITTLDYDNDNDEDDNNDTTMTTTTTTTSNEIDQLHFYPFGRRTIMTPGEGEPSYDELVFEKYRNGFFENLSQSVYTRVCSLPALTLQAPDLIQPEWLETKSTVLPGRVGVLFSGGLDSMVLAAIANLHVPTDEPIHLVNVAFGEGDDWKKYDNVPDRIAAISGLAELTAISPSRPWHLIKVNVSTELMEWAKRIVYQLSFPAITIMDMTISLALWFAARAEGVVHGREQEGRFMSTSRVLLVGAGADEQLAGYGRHRSAFNRGSYQVLQSELNKDFNRIWKRNLGRDDRVMSSCQREPRFPYLDENVIKYLNSVPLSYVCDMTMAQGTGDKRILRQIGKWLGLTASTALVKKAIQFGSRSSKQLNKNVPARVTQKCGKEVFSFTKPLYDPLLDPDYPKNKAKAQQEEKRKNQKLERRLKGAQNLEKWKQSQIEKQTKEQQQEVQEEASN